MLVVDDVDMNGSPSTRLQMFGDCAADVKVVVQRASVGWRVAGDIDGEIIVMHYLYKEICRRHNIRENNTQSHRFSRT